jgi:signal transduction histidine kinase
MQAHQLVITFCDYGKGIAAADLPQIFDPFFTTGGGSGGMGLGLHIVDQIVTQQLQGSIRCESTEGKGAIFFITIPT